MTGGRAVVLRGDARSLPLPDECVDLIVTSPPYFGLRSYTDGGIPLEGQIGSEETPRKYIAALLACTKDWIRVLKPGGSIFVNIGDKYVNSSASGAHRGGAIQASGYSDHESIPGFVPDGMRPKSLMGLPWRYPQGTYGRKQAGEYQRAGPPTRPALVVDPFGGTGTTALVASVLGRNSITFDRSADYCRLARWRTTDPGERARALGVPKPPPVPDGQASLFDLTGEAP